MELRHEFTVPTPVEETWAHFNDIASVAECFPGAQVTSVEGETFRGSCKVKLGPIALVYNGSGTFLEKDDAAHRFVVEAKGKDKRGNGTAGAHVTLSMAESGGGTAVEVLTDLAITGKPAQFGRGVMQDVSDKLLGQFVTCLETRLTGGHPDTSGEPGPTHPAGAPGDSGSGAAAAAASEPEGGGSSSPLTPAAPQPPPDSATPAPAPAPPYRPAPPAQDDALDLGATVLPVLLKTYWKQGAIGLAVVAILAWLLSRRG